MTESADLLFELGTEELPPGSLETLSGALETDVVQQLDEAGFSHGAIESFATPRRLAFLIHELDWRQPDRVNERKGPALSAAFDADGNPTKAGLGFARSCGVEFDRLQTVKTDRGERLGFSEQVHGETLEQCLPAMIGAALARLPIARRMRWGSQDTEFVRPVHWVVLIHGDRLLNAEILGLKTQACSNGHRFLSSAPIQIDQARDYARLLESQGKIIAGFETRRQKIVELATRAASQRGGTAAIEPKLLDEITALVEWPVAIVGEFDPQYLELPPEVLVTTMQSNQKYFPLRDSESQLMPCFIAISNIESTCTASVVSGNERVIRPRLADADFFWKQDRRQSLQARVPELDRIVFQQKLGSLADKARRTGELCATIAARLDRESAPGQRASVLAKTDLVTRMVVEFPSLQGIIGRYYAIADGEPAEVAAAVEEQYLPKYSGGDLPQTETGEILSLADKIDTLAGIFGAGMIPSGDRDPFGLRRAALGVLRILVEKQLDLDLQAMLEFAVQQLPAEANNNDALDNVQSFVSERFRGYCLERGYQHDEFEAVLATGCSRPVDFDLRLKAVKHFRTLPASTSLCAANKRIRNILRQTDNPAPASVNPELFDAAGERNLWDAAEAAPADIAPLIQQRNYAAALTRLADLAPAVDSFFDTVMVMCEDPAQQSNRLALLDRVGNLYLQIADISRLQ